jgi:anti-sigma factor RsiW
MTQRAAANDDLRCLDFVRVVSAYVDGELDEAERARIARHLEGCEGCQAAIDQFQTVIRVTGRLSPADVASLDPLLRDRLMATLRIPRRR